MIDMQEPNATIMGYYFNKTNAGEMLFVTIAHLSVYLHHPALIFDKYLFNRIKPQINICSFS